MVGSASRLTVFSSSALAAGRREILRLPLLLPARLRSLLPAANLMVGRWALESNTRLQTRFWDELSTDTPILRLQVLRTSRRTLLMLAPERRQVISAPALHTKSVEERNHLTREALR